LNNIDIRTDLNIIKDRFNKIEVLNSSVMEKEIPQWLSALDEEDFQFLKRLVLTSGSLKALSEEYGVSYPTLRARLDRLIAKVKAADNPKITDSYQRELEILLAEGRIDAATARRLLRAHKKSQNNS
jgi:hypothetical protein